MKKQTVSPIITHFLRTAFILVLLVLAVYVMPGVLGQRMSKEALKAQATKASAKADVPLVRQQAPRPFAPAVCTLDGVLGTAPSGGSTGTLNVRLFRPGTATTCASAPYPGTSGAGPYIYNVHNITNSTGSAACTNVTLHYVSGGTPTVNFAVAAFQAPFAAADISNAARYLGDPGVSSANPPVDTTFSVNIPAGANVALVVFQSAVNTAPQGQGAIYQLILDQDIFCGPPAPNIVPNGSALIKEGCVPPNSAVDPGETVTVDLRLLNSGAAATTNLVASLAAGGGVTNPSGPQNYGAIAPGGTAIGTYTFNAQSALQCGGVLTATLQLIDNGNPLPNVSFSFTAGAKGPPFFTEDFDGVVAPALPAGWIATNAVNPDNIFWVTDTVTPDSPPNDAFVNEPTVVSDKYLDTPPIAISSPGSEVKFRNFYNLESTFDGGVLEVSSPNINGGAFTDITAAAVGGSFVSGGYNATISTGFMSPIAGRMAWSGNAGSYINTVANLGPNVVGQTIMLRFRMASDTSATAAGWRIDNVLLNSPLCCVGQTDHFKAYPINPPIPPPLNVPVQLKDQFDQNFEPRLVLDPFRFANPVQKVHNGNMTPITNPAAHLKLYNLNQAPTTQTRVVNVYNQFGEQRLFVQDSRYLAVPTQKNGQGQVANLDHLKCYQCTGNPMPNVVVDLTDQFHFEPQVQVLQPVLFCNPVVKIHNGNPTPILHPADHLVFYAINPQPPFNIAVTTQNQFGPENLQLREADLLGVPSLKQFALNRAVSRKIHGGAGTFDINLPVNGTEGVECRSGGTTADYTMVLTFVDPVTVNGSPQAQVTMGAGTIGTNGVGNGGMVTVNGNEVTIPLTNMANAQHINVTLNRVNSVGNVVIPFGILIGDVSAGGTVNATDVSSAKLQSGQAVSASNFRNDVIVTGSINSTDVSTVKLKSGTALPP